MSTGTISADEWSHVVFEFQGGVGYKFYINGELDRQVSNSDIGLYQYSGTCYIGEGTSTPQSNFGGGLDDVRIYDRTLSATEIEKLASYEDERFDYDKLGNRESVVNRDGTIEDYGVNNVTNRYDNLAGTPDINHDYDVAGNMTDDHRGYDYENRVIHILVNSLHG